MNIDRRSFITGTASGVAAGLVGSRAFSFIKNIRNDSPTNFIVILADDMRWDAMRIAGNRIIKTPQLDALAEDGTIFTNNFVTTSICPTSRASIFTGQYARRHGIWDFATPLSSEQFRLTYPGLFRQAGYQTAFIGKWGLGGPLPQSQFDFWKGFKGQGFYFGSTGNNEEHLTGLISRQAAEFLKNAKQDKPLCLIISFKAPHVQDGDPDPFKPDPKFAHLYKDATIPRPATATEEHFKRLPVFLRDSEGRERWKRRFSNDELYQYSVKQYYRLITGLDEAVGKIVTVLRESRMYENTCIVFTSDNGFFLGEHGLAGKWWGYEESIRTPLIIKPPEKPLVPRVSAMTLNIDLSPTLLEMAGLPKPELTQGVSLAPLMTEALSSGRDDWFYEHLFDSPAIAKSEGIRTVRYKYLQFIDKRESGEILFDLYNDPFEENNIAADLENQSLLQSLKKKISQMRIDLT